MRPFNLGDIVSIKRMDNSFGLIWLKLGWLMLCCLLLFYSKDGQALVLDSTDKKINLVPHVQVLVDHSGSLSFEELKSGRHDLRFKTLAQNAKELNFGFTDATYWVKVELSRRPNAPSTWMLEIPYVAIDEVDWFDREGLRAISGTMRDISDRQVFSRVHVFIVDVDVQPQQYYLRFKSSYSLTLPLELMRSDVYSQQQLLDTMIQSLYYGGLLSLLLYNLVIFITNRDRHYLYYCLFTLCVGLGMYAGNGYGRLFLWSDQPGFDRVSQGVFLAAGSGLAILFSITFLELKDRLTVTYKILALLSATCFLTSALMLASIFVSFEVGWLYITLFGLGTIGAIVCVFAAIYLSRWKQVREAYYFFLSWTSICIGAVVASLRAFDLIPSNVFTLYAFQISSGIEALLFSFALAGRIRKERLAKEMVQEKLLESKEETVRALKQSEEKLEQAVDIRTQEIRAMLVKEQKIRDQYVRFGAMIAHEFRNPLNVIEAQNTLLEIDPSVEPRKVIKRVGVIRSAVTRLASLFDQWLQSDRLSQAFAKITPLPIDAVGLVNDVVNASRSYQADHQILSFNSDSPLVIRADYGLLRMAMLNLVDNACKYSPNETIVCLGVELRENWVGLFVKDQGEGIPLEKQSEIFQPYVQVTPQERLVGVGLGLSFVKRIIDLHEGRIEVQSQPNQGSTFTLWLKRVPDA